MPSIRPGGTNSLKKIDFSTPPRTCTSRGGRCTRADFSLHYSSLRRPTTAAPAQQQHVGAPPRPLCEPRAAFGKHLWRIYRPLGSKNSARAPRRLCALSRPGAPSDAERTGRNRHLRTRHVPNLACNPNGDEKKMRFSDSACSCCSVTCRAHPPQEPYGSGHN